MWDVVSRESWVLNRLQDLPICQNQFFLPHQYCKRSVPFALLAFFLFWVCLVFIWFLIFEMYLWLKNLGMLAFEAWVDICGCKNDRDLCFGLVFLNFFLFHEEFVWVWIHGLLFFWVVVILNFFGGDLASGICMYELLSNLSLGFNDY